MRAQIAAVTVVILLVCLGIVVPAAHAQGNCSMKTFAGTYAIYEKGSSVTIDLTKPGVLLPAPGSPTNPVAWEAPGIVPFVTLAEVTFRPDGTGDGFFWISAGSVGAAIDPIPLEFTVTEVNPDCTGKFNYKLKSGAVLEERFIIFDEGRQFRSVPTTLAPPAIPTLAWIGTGHRISNASAPVTFCGSQTAHGEYLMTCENIIRTGPYPDKAVADTLMLRMDVGMDGDYTGNLYEKFGKSSIDGMPVSGTVTVNPDCSFNSTLWLEGGVRPIYEVGIYFNKGKDFYMIAISDPANPDGQGIKSSFCQGTRIGQ